MQVAEDPGTGKLTTDKIYIDRFLEVTNSILILKIKPAPLVAPSGCWKTFRLRYDEHGKKSYLNYEFIGLGSEIQF